MAALFFWGAAGASLATTIRQIVPKAESDAPIPAAAKLAAALEPLIGQEATPDRLALIAERIEAHYLAEDRLGVLVSVPEISRDGIVRPEVVETRGASIQFEGGLHLPTHRWRRGLEKFEGSVLLGSEWQRELDWLNRGTFSQATLAASPTANDLSQADVRLRLSDAAPWRLTVGHENNGIEPLGRNRYSLGLQAGYLLGWDHECATSLVSGDDPDEFLAGSAAWRIFLPWRHELSLTGTILRTAAVVEHAGSPLRIEGETVLASLRYVIPWRINLSCKAETSLTFDFKQFDTALAFGVASEQTHVAEVAAFHLTQGFEYAKDDTKAGILLEAVWSPGGLTAHATDAAYGAFVEGASAEFWALRGSMGLTHRFASQASLVLRLAAQWADGPLLPSEDIALTGASAVRGYPERMILGRHGLWGSVEFQLPPQEPLPALRWAPAVFLDAGQSWASDAGGAKTSLLSAGVGLRLQFRENASLRADLAWPLHALPNDDHDPRLHLACQLLF